MNLSTIVVALILAAGPSKFDFGSAPSRPGFVQVSPTTAYDKTVGYGFDPGPKVVGAGGFCTSDGPFSFSVAVPEGNYRVTVTLGDVDGESATTIKAESRRLMVEDVRTSKREFASRTFTVNVRDPKFRTGGVVRLKARERDVLQWDDRLTIEFNGHRPCVDSVEIVPVEDAVTVYLAGDSTVTDQPLEPWNSWGQMLTRFFNPGVAVANHAESGESLKSFVSEKRLDKIMSTIKPGDYLFIQFGHNDQKDKAVGAGAFTSYQELLERFVADARSKGANPVLVTPMNRRSFGPDGKLNESLGDFPEAVRRASKKTGAPLIDLHAMSRPFYESMGVERSKKAFVDNTHHNAYGSYELARCVVQGIRLEKLDLARFLDDSVGPFDPAHPDPIDSFKIPASAKRSATAPDGN